MTLAAEEVSDSDGARVTVNGEHRPGSGRLNSPDRYSAVSSVICRPLPATRDQATSESTRTTRVRAD